MICNFFVLQDAGSEGIGFMLGSLSVQWALTSEACYKGLSKSPNGEVSSFKGKNKDRHML